MSVVVASGAGGDTGGVGDKEETAEALRTREELSSFPVFELDWSAYEELKFIEAVEKYGIGNWEYVRPGLVNS